MQSILLLGNGCSRANPSGRTCTWIGDALWGSGVKIEIRAASELTTRQRAHIRDWLIEEFGRRMKKAVTVSPEAMAVLQSYHWPGNVRELENVLERAMHMVDGPKLNVEHLPEELRAATIGGSDEAILTLSEAERQAIIRAGRALRGNVTQMANALAIGRTTLWRKMKAFGLSPDSFKRFI